MGIAHPTGYPLLTLLINCASLLPIGCVIHRISLLMSFFCASAILLLLLTGKIFRKSSYAIIPIIFLFAFDSLFMDQARSPEVYGFHILLISAFLFTILKHSITNQIKYFYLACFIAGLALTNHLLSIFTLPFFFLCFPRITLNRLTQGICFLMSSLSLYLYLPIRSSKNLLFAWKNPQNLDQFISHVTGAQFRELMLDNFATRAAVETFSNISRIDCCNRTLLLGLAAFGLFSLWRKNRLLILAILSFTLTNIIFAISYNIHDIEVYYLPILWIISVLALWGANRLFIQLKPGFSIVLVIIFICFAGASIWKKYKQENHLFTSVAQNYGIAIFRSLPPNSLLFYQGDNPMNIFSYYSVIEKKRPDVTFLDMNRNLLPLNGHKTSSKFQAVRASTYRGLNINLAYPHGVIYIQSHNTARIKAPPDDLINPLLPNVSMLREAPIEDRETACEFLINRAEYESEIGIWSKGIDLYSKASSLCHDIPGVGKFLAVIMNRRGLLSKTIKLEETLHGKFPEDINITNNLAFHYFEKGTHLTQALFLAHEATESDSKNENFRTTLLKIVYALRDFDTADELLRNNRGFSPQLISEITSAKQLDLEFNSNKGKSIDYQLQKYYEAGCFTLVRISLLHKATIETLDTHEIELLSDSAEKSGSYSGAIEYFEKRLHEAEDREIVIPLIHLHELSKNYARIKQLSKLL